MNRSLANMRSDAIWTVGTFVTIAVVFWLIVGWANVSLPGPEEHAEALPAKVIQLSPSRYLIRDKTDPYTICRGSSYQSDDSIDHQTQVKSFDNANYIVCNVNQHWASKHTKRTQFGPGLIAAANTLWFWIVLAVGGLVALIYMMQGWAWPAHVLKRNQRKVSRVNAAKAKISESREREAAQLVEIERLNSEIEKMRTL